MGVKYAKNILGTGRDGQFSKIIDKFWKKWPTLQGPGRFSRDFIPTSIISKGYFIRIKFGAAQTGCIFEVRGHCAAPDWGCRKNPWLISYLWTKICWKQFWAGQLFWIDDPYPSSIRLVFRRKWDTISWLWRLQRPPIRNFGIRNKTLFQYQLSHIFV